MINKESTPTAGFVWLVGAGPGAVDLITVRGKKAIENAQVIIYDSLIGSELLQYSSGDCIVIFVGKRAGRHSATQEEINNLLVSQASTGKRVVRLKGGDPSIFGRLGEEIAVLRQAGIPYEVVPGVTAACAAAASAGVSLTQRGIASATVFATGHECAGKSVPVLDWASLAQPNATLCVYMGTRSLGALAEQLMTSGHSPETPIMIVSNASLPNQKVRTGTLEIAADVATEAVGDPSLIIIGEIAAQQVATLSTAGQRRGLANV